MLPLCSSAPLVLSIQGCPLMYVLVSAAVSKAASLSASVPPPLMQVSPIHSLSGKGTVTPQNKSSYHTWVQMGVKVLSLNSEERCVASNKDVDIPGNTGQDLEELCHSMSNWGNAQ